jgi:hypothetical protein
VGYTLSGGVSSYGGGTFETDDGTTFEWFDPLALLEAEVGSGDSRYQFWCQACASAIQPYLVNINTLIQTPAPYYTCLDATSVADVSEPGAPASQGICTIFEQWMYSLFWSQKTGQPENSCGQYPGG